MPPSTDQSDTVIQSAENGESNGLDGKPEFNLHFSRPGIVKPFFFFCYLRSVPGNWARLEGD